MGVYLFKVSVNKMNNAYWIKISPMKSKIKIQNNNKQISHRISWLPFKPTWFFHVGGLLCLSNQSSCMVHYFINSLVISSTTITSHLSLLTLGIFIYHTFSKVSPIDVSIFFLLLHKLCKTDYVFYQN